MSKIHEAKRININIIMGKKQYLVLHKSEWDRLNRKNGLKEDETEQHQEREEYFRKLVDKSQSWIKTWPDTVQGHVEQVSRENQKKRKQNLTFLKARSKKYKEEISNTQSEIENSKQMIFQNSCYGRKLLSALLESKIVEERNLQIQFQAKLQEEAKKREQDELAKMKLYNNMSFKQEDETIMKRKQLSKEISNINQCMHNLKLTQDATQKTKIENEERECALLTRELLENETKQQLHRDKQDTEQSRNHYELVKKVNAEVKSRYDTFLEAGIKRQEDKLSNKEEEELHNLRLKRKKCYDIAQENMKEAQAQQLCPCKIANKSVCDRQTLFCNSHTINKKSTNEPNEKSAVLNTKKESFLYPSKKLIEALKLRKQEASPWNGLTGAHATFARNAADTLKECRHKIFARKVVDEYRKNNGLDATTLPIDNYF
ncbi:unnamed protein product [Chilo suppressalis]|uniref:Uncharacterized protein n=1 Tax=Chilo suppressalis TaxID=168631 RepID=A0ABN8L342_CHISP|nr:unnamed protein product [Chilo suppressalis]